MKTHNLIFAGLIIIFLVSTICFSNDIIQNHRENEAFETLANQVKKQIESNDNSQIKGSIDTQNESSELEILPQYKELYEQNTDMAGWIEIEGTQISYPVMHTSDDVEYYLRRSFDKTDSIAGTPFIGYGCSLEPRSDNVLIYGHHMKNGTMFSAILSYKDKSFWEQHPIIKFDTLYEKGKYEVMAAFYVTANIENGHFQYYNFNIAQKEEDFDAYVNTVKELSLYDTGVISEYGDHLITLSTCSYHSKDGRFVVVARRNDNLS